MYHRKYNTILAALFLIFMSLVCLPRCLPYKEAIVIRLTVYIYYSDVIIGAVASQITSLLIVYSTVYSGADQRKHQSSVSLASVRENHRWPVNYPHKCPVSGKMFPFDDAIMSEVNTGAGHIHIWVIYHNLSHIWDLKTFWDNVFWWWRGLLPLYFPNIFWINSC